MWPYSELVLCNCHHVRMKSYGMGGHPTIQWLVSLWGEGIWRPSQKTQGRSHVKREAEARGHLEPPGAGGGRKDPPPRPLRARILPHLDSAWPPELWETAPLSQGLPAASDTASPPLATRPRVPAALTSRPNHLHSPDDRSRETCTPVSGLHCPTWVRTPPLQSRPVPTPSLRQLL